MKTTKIPGISMFALCAMAAAALGVSASTAFAQEGGYWQEPAGNNMVWKNNYGQCWRSGSWTPAMATMECDPDLVPKPAPAPAAPPPAPAAAPTPAPAAAAAPAAPKRCDSTVTLANEEVFAFNKSVLTAKAMTRLDTDVVAKAQQCGKLELIIVSGHTDRIGSQQYNQKLSERRAEAVKAYLVKKGLAADKIDTMGMGKTLQIKSCPDDKNRKALHDCLAPNRRAVIEIRGLAK